MFTIKIVVIHEIQASVSLMSLLNALFGKQAEIDTLEHELRTSMDELELAIKSQNTKGEING